MNFTHVLLRRKYLLNSRSLEAGQEHVHQKTKKLKVNLLNFDCCVRALSEKDARWTS